MYVITVNDSNLKPTKTTTEHSIASLPPFLSIVTAVWFPCQFIWHLVMHVVFGSKLKRSFSQLFINSSSMLISVTFSSLFPQTRVNVRDEKIYQFRDTCTRNVRELISGGIFMSGFSSPKSADTRQSAIVCPWARWAVMLVAKSSGNWIL